MSIKDYLTQAQSLINQAISEITPSPITTSFYSKAIIDTVPRPKPTPVILGPAGFTFTDPTFGSQITRVTDRQTSGNLPLRVASNAHISEWNVDGSGFYVLNSGGGIIFYSYLNGVTKQLVNLNIDSYIEPCFSFVARGIIYGASGDNHRTINTYDIIANTKTELLNLDKKYPQLNLIGYIGGLLFVDNDVWVTFFGGEQQDTHYLIHHSIAGLLDVTSLGFSIHSVSMERNGRFVNIYPTSPDLARGVAQVQVWDTVTNKITPVTKLPGGHGCHGYGNYINQDCCTQSTWDAAQWQYRDLATPNITRDVIKNVLLPKEIYWDDHSNYRHAKPNVNIPFVSSTFRYGTTANPNLTPRRAWDDEIIAVDILTGTVYRFANHQSTIDTEFWNQPIINVAPDGHSALFTSNMGKTLGVYTENGVSKNRQDVFLIRLE